MGSPTKFSFWTEDRDALARAGWERGTSATKIAAQLGYGCSRNAVIGRAHRMGWRSPNTIIVDPAKTRRARARTATRFQQVKLRAAIPTKPLPTPPVEDEFDGLPRKALMALTSTDCRWPIGDPGQPGFGFCGRYADPAIPYCAYHARVAYNPVVRR